MELYYSISQHVCVKGRIDLNWNNHINRFWYHISKCIEEKKTCHWTIIASTYFSVKSHGEIFAKYVLQTCISRKTKIQIIISWMVKVSGYSKVNQDLSHGLLMILYNSFSELWVGHTISNRTQVLTWAQILDNTTRGSQSGMMVYTCVTKKKHVKRVLFHDQVHVILLGVKILSFTMIAYSLV